jgi:hypothetical protein
MEIPCRDCGKPLAGSFYQLQPTKCQTLLWQCLHGWITSNMLTYLVACCNMGMLKQHGGCACLKTRSNQRSSSEAKIVLSAEELKIRTYWTIKLLVSGVSKAFPAGHPKSPHSVFPPEKCGWYMIAPCIPNISKHLQTWFSFFTQRNQARILRGHSTLAAVQGRSTRWC